MATTKTPTRGSKGKAADQETPSQEVATREEANTPTPQVENPTPTPPVNEQEETPAPKLGGAGVWDSLGFWVTILLMRGEPTLKDKGVTSTQVAEFILGMDLETFTQLVSVGAIPQGASLADLAFPLKGEGGWTRKLDNTLWRMCEATPGHKQAGGGKYTPALLVRNMGTKPVTFTLADGVTFPEEISTSQEVEVTS